MTVPELGMTTLSTIPNIKVLLLKAGLKKSRYSQQKSSEISLPNNQFYFNGFELDSSTCKSYHQVNGWQLESDVIHPCYLHSLAFPLHIMLLLLPEFPFPILGLVHVNNQIRQLRPIKKGEKLTVSSGFGQLELHPKGWLFSIKVKFYSGSELVWQSISTNLFRTKHDFEVEQTTKIAKRTFINPINTNRQLSADLGRRYAKVSGDFNPIHLTKWSAKLFGFKQAIIHGMWTKSYCVSELHKIKPLLLSQAFEINTTFKRPLYLPSQVNMAVQPCASDDVHDKLHFNVVGIDADNEPAVHLVGDIRAI